MHDDAIPSNQPALRNVACSAGIPPFLLARQPKLQVAKPTLHVTANPPPPPAPESRLHSSVVAVSSGWTRPGSACRPNLSDVMVSKQPLALDLGTTTQFSQSDRPPFLQSALLASLTTRTNTRAHLGLRCLLCFLDGQCSLPRHHQRKKARACGMMSGCVLWFRTLVFWNSDLQRRLSSSQFRMPRCSPRSA